MKTKATYEELQNRINELSNEVRNSSFDFLSVSPEDTDTEVLNFEKKEQTLPGYVTDWEMD